MTETIPDDQPDEQPRAEDRPDTTESGQSSPENHGESPSPGDDGSSDESIGLPAARRTAIDAAEDLLKHEFEGVIKIEATDTDGWRALVEVLEREAVPDTQDILGRYEITMDSTGQVDGYGLLERYRRGELKEEL